MGLKLWCIDIKTLIGLKLSKEPLESEKNLNSNEKWFISEMYKLLDDDKISEVVTAKLREKRAAGNMVVVARKISWLCNVAIFLVKLEISRTVLPCDQVYSSKLNTQPIST